MNNQLKSKDFIRDVRFPFQNEKNIENYENVSYISFQILHNQLNNPFLGTILSSSQDF